MAGDTGFTYRTQAGFQNNTVNNSPYMDMYQPEARDNQDYHRGFQDSYYEQEKTVQDNNMINPYPNQDPRTHQMNGYSHPMQTNYGSGVADITQSPQNHGSQTLEYGSRSTDNDFQRGYSGYQSQPLTTSNVTMHDEIWNEGSGEWQGGDTASIDAVVSETDPGSQRQNPGISSTESDHSYSSQDTMVMANTDNANSSQQQINQRFQGHDNPQQRYVQAPISQDNTGYHSENAHYDSYSNDQFDPNIVNKQTIIPNSDVSAENNSNNSQGPRYQLNRSVSNRRDPDYPDNTGKVIHTKPQDTQSIKRGSPEPFPDVIPQNIESNNAVQVKGTRPQTSGQRPEREIIDDGYESPDALSSDTNSSTSNQSGSQTDNQQVVYQIAGEPTYAKVPPNGSKRSSRGRRVRFNSNIAECDADTVFGVKPVRDNPDMVPKSILQVKNPTQVQEPSNKPTTNANKAPGMNLHTGKVANFRAMNDMLRRQNEGLQGTQAPPKPSSDNSLEQRLKLLTVDPTGQDNTISERTADHPVSDVQRTLNSSTGGKNITSQSHTYVTNDKQTDMANTLRPNDQNYQQRALSPRLHEKQGGYFGTGPTHNAIEDNQGIYSPSKPPGSEYNVNKQQFVRVPGYDNAISRTVPQFSDQAHKQSNIASRAGAGSPSRTGNVIARKPGVHTVIQESKNDYQRIMPRDQKTSSQKPTSQSLANIGVRVLPSLAPKSAAPRTESSKVLDSDTSSASSNSGQTRVLGRQHERKMNSNEPLGSKSGTKPVIGQKPAMPPKPKSAMAALFPNKGKAADSKAMEPSNIPASINQEHFASNDKTRDSKRFQRAYMSSTKQSHVSPMNMQKAASEGRKVSTYEEQRPQYDPSVPQKQVMSGTQSVQYGDYGQPVGMLEPAAPQYPGKYGYHMEQEPRQQFCRAEPGSYPDEHYREKETVPRQQPNAYESDYQRTHGAHFDHNSMQQMPNGTGGFDNEGSELGSNSSNYSDNMRQQDGRYARYPTDQGYNADRTVEKHKEKRYLDTARQSPSQFQQPQGYDQPNYDSRDRYRSPSPQSSEASQQAKPKMVVLERIALQPNPIFIAEMQKRMSVSPPNNRNSQCIEPPLSDSTVSSKKGNPYIDSGYDSHSLDNSVDNSVSSGGYRGPNAAYMNTANYIEMQGSRQHQGTSNFAPNYLDMGQDSRDNVSHVHREEGRPGSNLPHAEQDTPSANEPNEKGEKKKEKKKDGSKEKKKTSKGDSDESKAKKKVQKDKDKKKDTNDDNSEVNNEEQTGKSVSGRLTELRRSQRKSGKKKSKKKGAEEAEAEANAKLAKDNVDTKEPNTQEAHDDYAEVLKSKTAIYYRMDSSGSKASVPISAVPQDNHTWRQNPSSPTQHFCPNQPHAQGGHYGDNPAHRDMAYNRDLPPSNYTEDWTYSQDDDDTLTRHSSGMSSLRKYKEQNPTQANYGNPGYHQGPNITSPVGNFSQESSNMASSSSNMPFNQDEQSQWNPRFENSSQGNPYFARSPGDVEYEQHHQNFSQTRVSGGGYGEGGLPVGSGYPVSSMNSQLGHLPGYIQDQRLQAHPNQRGTGTGRSDSPMYRSGSLDSVLNSSQSSEPGTPQFTSTATIYQLLQKQRMNPFVHAES